ncbi:TRAP transporter small permease [Treponema zioleckii]|uniref:TRAP transporter small permease n=1 Tax=Treponema zioleckii TaxID=331680 RepID=UPI00168A4013|nr:TRAP transporter small permease [Treponema zioleckii]
MSSPEKAILLQNIILSVVAVFYLFMLILCFTSKKTAIAIDKAIHKVMLVIAEIALGSMIVIVFVNVVLRYCFHSGIGWVEEVPRLLVTLFAFCACAMGVRDHLHISVTVLYSRFPKLGKKALDWLYDIAVFGCGLFMLYFGTKFTCSQAFLTGRLPMTGWNTCVQYFPVGVGGFIIVMDSILFLTKTLTSDDLLYSEKEVDYAEMMRQNETEKNAATN